MLVKGVVCERGEGRVCVTEGSEGIMRGKSESEMCEQGDGGAAKIHSCHHSEM